MKLVSVVLDIPTQALDSTFTYVAVENEADHKRLFAAKEAQASSNSSSSKKNASTQPAQLSFSELFSMMERWQVPATIAEVNRLRLMMSCPHIVMNQLCLVADRYLTMNYQFRMSHLHFVVIFCSK